MAKGEILDHMGDQLVGFYFFNVHFHAISTTEILVFQPLPSNQSPLLISPQMFPFY